MLILSQTRLTLHETMAPADEKNSLLTGKIEKAYLVPNFFCLHEGRIPATFFKTGSLACCQNSRMLITFFRSEGVTKPNIINSATIQQLRKAQGSSVQTKLGARGIHAKHARGQLEKARRSRKTLRRSLSTGHFGKRSVHEIRSNEPTSYFLMNLTNN